MERSQQPDWDTYRRMVEYHYRLRDGGDDALALASDYPGVLDAILDNPRNFGLFRFVYGGWMREVDVWGVYTHDDLTPFIGGIELQKGMVELENPYFRIYDARKLVGLSPACGTCPAGQFCAHERRGDVSTV